MQVRWGTSVYGKNVNKEKVGYSGIWKNFIDVYNPYIFIPVLWHFLAGCIETTDIWLVLSHRFLLHLKATFCSKWPTSLSESISGQKTGKTQMEMYAWYIIVPLSLSISKYRQIHTKKRNRKIFLEKKLSFLYILSDRSFMTFDLKLRAPPRTRSATKEV